MLDSPTAPIPSVRRVTGRLGALALLVLAACDIDTSRFRPGPADVDDGFDLFDTDGLDTFDDATADAADALDADATDLGDIADGSAGDIVEIDISTPVPTLDDVYDQVFSVACVQCHVDRVSGGLSLRNDVALLDRLLAPSVQLPSMARVAPGDPDNSYLWLKLIGDHEVVGGSGQRMPLSGSIDGESLDLVERFIRDGIARDDESATASE